MYIELPTTTTKIKRYKHTYNRYIGLLLNKFVQTLLLYIPGC